MIGVSCFCGTICPRCRSESVRTGEFERCRSTLENGASVMLGLPQKASSTRGIFGGSSKNSPQKVSVWLALDCDQGALQWATLQQRQGKPLDQGQIPVTQVLGVRNTGVLVEISSTEYTQPITLEFGDATERDAWSRHLEVAVQVLTPESERAALDEARAGHRQREMEERRAINEERRKKLQEGLGMRFTAEAMMARDASKGSAGAE